MELLNSIDQEDVDISVLAKKVSQDLHRSDAPREKADGRVDLN
eukprot:gene43167-53583_t